MNARVQLLGVCAATVLLTRGSVAQTVTNTNALYRAVSASRQFTAYAPSALWAPALCVFAERVKREWLAQLGATDAWRDPIVLVVRARDAGQSQPPVALRVFQTDIGLKYQIDCVVPPPLDETMLLTSIVEALCAEGMNRRQRIDSRTAYVAPDVPRWLVDGLAQAMQNRADIWLGLVRRSVAAGRPLTARSLLEATQEPNDEMIQLQLFHAKAWLFTEGLLALPHGDEKMQRFLGEIGESKSASGAFWAVYRDDFPKPVTLEKWWYVRLAERTLSNVAQNLATRETLRQLDAALATRLTRGDPPEPEQEVGLRELATFRKEKWFLPVLETKVRVLEVLRNQALPRDRELIDRYTKAIRALHEKKLEDFARSIDGADAARQTSERGMRAIHNYLDAAERIYAPQDLAGMFTGYFRTLDEQRDIEQQRRSPISDYLDTFDH